VAEPFEPQFPDTDHGALRYGQAPYCQPAAEGTRVAHKTGTLSNTASDVGIIHTPDGRAIAVAIYVTGQGGKPNRDARIATIARAIYDGYLTESSGVRRTASR